MLKVVHDVEAANEPAGGSLLDEIVRDGARAMLAVAPSVGSRLGDPLSSARALRNTDRKSVV